MTEPNAKTAREGLLAARGFIAGVIERLEHAPRELVDLLTQVDRSIGATLGKDRFHDAGAYGCCSNCRRYSADVRIITSQWSPGPSSGVTPTCDCGASEWEPSFNPPGPDAQWSTGLKNLGGAA